VFPRIGKVGFIIVGGHGEGEVYEKGKMVGVASVTIATVGLQAGIQDYSEIIFFENQAALDRFKQNNFEFTAGMSAVALTAGAAKSANYRNGVVVFTQTTAGAMIEASLGTQKLNFKPDGGDAKK
jgi:lipid-binding SYLF domain-containing protein